MLDKKQKKLWLIIAIVVVVLFIIIVLSGKKAPEPIEEGLIPEGIDVENLPAAPEVKVTEPEAIAPGASEVTSEGIVVTEEGVPVKTENLMPMSEGTPKQSDLLVGEEKEKVEEKAISLEVSVEGGFSPQQFKVKPGQVVTVLLTSVDNQKHEFRFRDASLRGITIVVRAGQSRAITFNAPNQIGSYEFFCPYASHQEAGQMIVTEE